MRTRQDTTLDGAEQTWQHAPPSRHEEEAEMDAQRQREDRSLSAQFAYSRPVESERVRVWWREDENGVRGVPKATAMAVGLTYIAFAVFSPLLTTIPRALLGLLGTVGIDVPQVIKTIFLDGYPLNDTRPLWMHAVPTLLQVLPCLVVGAILARIVPRNAVRAAVRASVVLFVITLVNAIGVAFLVRGTFPTAYFVGVLMREVLQPILLIAAAWFFVRRQRLDR